MENEIKEPAPEYNSFGFKGGRVGPDEYLELERLFEEKSEYYEGRIVALNGHKINHARIQANLYAHIGSFLKQKEFIILPSSMRIGTPNRNAYLYPDAVIVGKQMEMEDDNKDTLINPVVVFEIWAPSIIKEDTGYKLKYYSGMPTVNEYIMIDSKERYAQHSRRQPDGSWITHHITHPAAGITIQAIGFTISLDDIYLNTGL